MRITRKTPFGSILVAPWNATWVLWDLHNEAAEIRAGIEYHDAWLAAYTAWSEGDE